MTKKQEKRLNRIQALLTECNSIISDRFIAPYQNQKIKKNKYIPFRERLNTLRSEIELKRLRFYL